MQLHASRQWVREQVAFLVVLAALVGAFCYLIFTPDHPIRGTLAIGITSLFAGLLRLVLPKTAAGLLAVRGRFVDVFFLVLFGGLIVASDIRLRH